MISFSPHQLKSLSLLLLLLTKTFSLVASYKESQSLTDSRTDTSTNLSPMHRYPWSMHNIATDAVGVPQ